MTDLRFLTDDRQRDGGLLPALGTCVYNLDLTWWDRRQAWMFEMVDMCRCGR